MFHAVPAGLEERKALRQGGVALDGHVDEVLDLLDAKVRALEAVDDTTGLEVPPGVLAPATRRTLHGG